jgi:hypothetical protein
MSELSRRFTERLAAKTELNSLASRPDQVIVVHYSCENFYEEKTDGSSPRVTSLAVRHYHSGQTWSYSIQAVAEERHVAPQNISGEYDQLERVMLDRFFEFVKIHRMHHWIHWNMRDMNYGFPAIEHRYRVLGGDPASIPDDHKHDLARLMVAMFGRRYIGHPRLKGLVDLNKITAVGMLDGKEEAAKFAAGEYHSLHRSTLRKVDVLANVFQRLAEGSIKTNASYLEARGITLSSAPAFVKEHPVFVSLTIISAILALGLRFSGVLGLFTK